MALRSFHRIWPVLGATLLAFSLALGPVTVHANDSSNGMATSVTGTYYTVQAGESWTGIARRFGVSVAQLRAANPALIRPDDVLWTGDRVFIPGTGATAIPQRPQAAPTTGYWYTVKRGDTWQTVARDTGVPVLELWHANPNLMNRNRWLYVGTKIWVPVPQSSAAAGPTEPAAEPAASATPVPTTVTLSVTPTETPAATPYVAATPIESPTQTVTSTAPLSGAVSGQSIAGCPTLLGDYTAAIGAYLNGLGATADGLRTWLQRCGAMRSQVGSVTIAGIQNPNSRDAVVALADPADTRPAPTGRLLVFHSLPVGYTLAGIAEGLGRIDVLRVADVNADGKTDIVWTDTTCTSAASCASTLFVDSWDGTAYRSWMTGQPTTPNAEYRFEPTPGSQALSIVVQSQSDSQSQPTTYVSIDGSLYTATQPRPGIQPAPATPSAPVSATGAPATQAVPAGAPTQQAAPTSPPTRQAAPTGQPAAANTPQTSACLSDEIIAANRAFDTWPTAGFGPAVQAYSAAIGDTAAGACSTVKDEVTLLRDFARYRLVVSLVGNGKASQSPAIKDQIATPALKGAAEAFLNSYNDARSIVQACRDATDYAKARPDAWEFLKDLGQPNFTATDLCPLAE